MPSREVTAVIVAALACAVAVLLVASWMGASTIPIMMIEELRMTDAQFGEGYLTITANNIGESVWVEISEIRVAELNQTYYHQLTGRMVNATVNERLPAGEHAIIIICNEWVSGYTYEIRLMTSRGNHFIQYAVAP